MNQRPILLWIAAVVTTLLTAPGALEAGSDHCGLSRWRDPFAASETHGNRVAPAPSDGSRLSHNASSPAATGESRTAAAGPVEDCAAITATTPSAPLLAFSTSFSRLETLPPIVPQASSTDVDPSDRDSSRPTHDIVRTSTPASVNQSVYYYKNRFEFSLDAGWLPINIPFVFDVFLGDAYNMTPLKYTLVPVVASVRWQMDDVGGPWIFRGNWDMTLSGSVTVIPRGPETRYFSYDMGIRRNFIPRNGKVAPYFDGRLGLGNIDAKGPKGVAYAQGQDFTFTMNMGSGVRFNVNPRYSVSAGLNWMHISNLYLSEPKYRNFGINVYGPMVGLDIRLGKHDRDISP